ncbi:MAG: AAA family ATPase, partial [Caldilineaceae bacterium]|nr:AAA family ATPase [Caldilineaceae bacterium]
MAQTLAEAYIPVDRRQALATGTALPEKNEGATLFVDISGFTPLTNALRRHYGPRRGAEELTRHLNRVYTALITEIERYRGSVIGFSGDAITCWFAAAQLTADDLQTALQQAVTAAFAVQQAMQSFQSIQLSQQQTIHLAVKTAIAAGMTRRLLVGDPRIQCIDVLAGSTLDRMAATEQMAQQGELVLDAASMAIIAEMLTVREWRTNPGTGQQYAVIETLAPIAEPAPWPAQPPLADAQVASWVLPAIASRLAEGHDRFLAELRPAAALFLKFTGLDYDHDAEAAENLNRYISWAQQVIHRYGGALIQLTTGDKGSYFYATFGAPLAHDDDIGRAVAVALVLRSSPERYSFIKQVHIGISYGTMRVGAYGSESRRTYGVLGNETNMAARFMAHAQPGQIVTSQVVAAAITGHYVIEPLGDIQLKGRTEPQPLFAVLGQQTQRELSRMLYTTPLIGRDQELATLQERARQLQQGEGSLLRIEGGAGIGKSHMVATFTQSLDQSVAPVRMVRGSGQSTAQDTAYFALRQVMQELLLSTQDAMPSAEQIDQLMPTLTTRNPHWALRLPLLGDLLGVPIPDNATTATFDARLRQEALITLTVEIIQHYAQERPLLLILEDVHWLDEASQGIVLALARTVHITPLLLLLVHRPPVREEEKFLREVTALPAQVAMVLTELDPAGVKALVAARLGGP